MATYIYDSSSSLLTLFFKELHQVSTTQHIQVDSDLIKKKNIKGLQQAKADLYPAPLSVWDSVHAPVRIDVKHLHELSSPRWINARKTIQHFWCRKVTLKMRQKNMLDETIYADGNMPGVTA